MSDGGHFSADSTFNQLPAYVTKLSTERGDVLRIYEWDRWNGTTWQVDLALDGETLVASVTLDNPAAEDTKGYWWTNVRYETTSPFGMGPGPACKPSDPSLPGSRVIAPAYATLASGGGRWNKAYWPKFEFNRWSPNQYGDAATDYSYVGNYSSAAEVWMLFAPERRRFHVLADPTVYADGLHGMFHGHTINEKVWAFGVDPIMSWGQEHAWGACFCELQTGVAPTQFHTFDIPARTNHSFVEVFKPMTGLASPAALYADNYTRAVEAVDEWLESDAGIPAAAYAATSEFMAEVARRPPDAVLAAGSSWAALDVLLSKYLGEAAPAPPAQLPFALDEKDEAVRPWLELVRDGTFSAATLASVPTSFQVGGRWERALRKSMRAHAPTWLHELHIGVILAERDAAGLAAALPLWRSSLARRPSATAWRCLAVAEPDPGTKFDLYASAWAAAPAESGAGAERLRRNLANEYAYALRVFGGENATALRALDAMVQQAAEAAEDDEVLLAKAAVLIRVRSDAAGAMQVLRSHDFAHYGHSDGQLASTARASRVAAARPMAAELWFEALALNATGGKRCLTPREEKHLRQANPPPDGVGPLSGPRQPSGWVPPLPGPRASS